MPSQIYQPMIPVTRESLPRGEEWIFEPKYPSWRIIGVLTARQTTLISSGGHDYGQRFSAVKTQLSSAIGGNEAVVDGQMVGCDEAWKPNLSALNRGKPRSIFYIFDLLELQGESLINQSLRERRERLESIFKDQENIRLTAQFTDGHNLAKLSGQIGMESVIAKKRDSVYKPGRRSPDWIKFLLNPHRFGV